MVTMGHGCDITPLLMSLASSKSLDVHTTEGVVVVGVVIANSTDMPRFAPTVGNLTVDLLMSP